MDYNKLHNMWNVANKTNEFEMSIFKLKSFNNKKILLNATHGLKELFSSNIICITRLKLHSLFRTEASWMDGWHMRFLLNKKGFISIQQL